MSSSPAASDAPPVPPLTWRDRWLLPPALLAVALSLTPLLILIKNPDFLKAQGLSQSDLAVLYFAVAVALPLGVHLPALVFDRLKGGNWGWRATCFVAFFLFQMPLLRNFPLATALAAGGITAAIGVQALLGWVRLRQTAALLGVLAWLGVGARFWLSSEVIASVEAMSGGKPLQALQFQRTETPVIMLLFDEFPLTALLDREGGIAVDHFPNFARLADRSTWYRVTRAVSTETVDAVPAILSGTRQDTVESLLTLLRESHRCVLFDDVIALAPPDGRLDLHRVGQSLRDLTVATLHAWSPRELARLLPPIDQGWVGFSNDEQRREQALDAFAEIEDRAGKPLFFFLHSLLPHGPYRYRESGVRSDPSLLAENARTPFDNPYTTFFLQARMTDGLLGAALDRIEKQGLWDKCLLIVVADHGRSFLPDYPPRSPEGLSGLHASYVPLFVKTPGQNVAAVVDSEISTVDILPLVLDCLAATQSPGWTLEGKRPDSQGLPSPTLARLLKQAQTKYRDYALGPQSSVYTVPEMAPWWGKPVPKVKASSAASYQLLNAALLGQVDLSSSTLPLALEAGVEGKLARGARLVWALNGVVAACQHPLKEVPSSSFFLSSPIPQSFLHEGANTVDLYEVVLDKAGAASWKRLSKKAARSYVLDSSASRISWDKGDSSLPIGAGARGTARAFALARGGWRVQLDKGHRDALEMLVFDQKGTLLATLPVSGGQTSQVLSLPAPLQPQSTLAYLRTQSQCLPLAWQQN